MTRRARSAGGQALPLVAGVLFIVMLGALALGSLAGGVTAHGDRQRAADLGALAAARAMRSAYPHVFEPARLDGRVNAAHIERSQYLAIAMRVAESTAEDNGAARISVSFPDRASLAPMDVVVRVSDDAPAATAEATLQPAADPSAGDGPVNAGEYPGPFAYRDGRPMRPDTALVYDRLNEAARADGIQLIVVSGFRSDAEQAVLFAAHPDPKWVAPPGKSLHRLGTELDLGPPSAYPWLDANAPRFHFIRRYPWEPWHFGLNLNAGSAHLGYRYTADRRTSLPSFVPAKYAPLISDAAQRWNVSAALLSAQLYVESGFNPFSRSGAGALGIAQFMPDTAQAYDLRDPFDARASIDAQGHLMRDLLRQFAAVPLALAAYNAGPVPVQRCGCVPPIKETQDYVAQILGLLHGAGDPDGLGLGGLDVRLVR